MSLLHPDGALPSTNPASPSGLGGGRIVSLQMLRFVAAMLVVFAHAVDLVQRLGLPFALPAVGDFGAIGVDIFFVISGFIITQTVMRRPGMAAGEFFRNRLVRVVPIYWLMTLPWVIWSAKLHQMSGERWIATLLFWPIFPSGVVEPFLAVGWTLCFEMLFYSTFALCLWAGSRRAFAVALACYAACALLRPVAPFPLAFLGNPIICEFLLGIAIAFAWSRAARFRAGGGGAALAISALFLLPIFAVGTGPLSDAGLVLDGSVSTTRVLLWGVPAALLVWGVLQFEPAARRLRGAALLSVLGDASFSLYLTHRLLFVFYEKAVRAIVPRLPAWGSYPVILLACALAVLVGWIAFRFVEQPLLLLRRTRPREFAGARAG